MPKKGQVTVFIILGIVILSVGGLLLYLVQNTQKEKLRFEQAKVTLVESKAQAVQSLMENCLLEATERALLFISRQGGYVTTPEPYLEFSIFKIPYYFDEKKLSVPDKGVIERQLAQYIEEDVNLCIQQWPPSPWNITLEENPSAQVTISPATVFVLLYVPTTVTVGDSRVGLDRFQVKIPSTLGTALEVRDSFLAEQEKYPDMVPLSELIQLTEKNKLAVDLQNVESTVIYQLFELSELSEEKLSGETIKKPVLTFAIRYPWQETEGLGEEWEWEEE